MWFEAIRLKEVGRFREGVAIEGLTQGLNLFAGPNETGKSTIFRALETVLHEAHTTQKSEVKNLRPYTGGAPLIECDFTRDGTAWRLTKQYFQGRSATLARRDGSDIYRGGDAEDKLAELLGTPGGLRNARDFLWVGQGGGFDPPRLGENQREVFAGLVQDEVDDATGAAGLAAIQRIVRADLFKWLTEGRRQPKTGGEYARAIEAHGRSEEALEQARNAATRSIERRQRMAELVDRERALASEETSNQQQARLAAAQAAHAKAVEARSQRDVAQARRGEAEAALNGAVAGLRSFEGGTAELQTAGERIAVLDAQRAELDTAILELTDRRDAAAARLVVLGTSRQAMHASQVAHERNVRIEQAVREITELRQRRDGASALATEIATLRKSLGGIIVGGQQVAELRSIEERRLTMTAQQAAAAPRLKVHYAGQREGSFEIDGEVLGDDAEVVVTGAARVTAGTIGAIDIIPAGGGDAARLAGDLAATEQQLDAALKTLGVKSIAEAEAIENERAGLERRLEALTARLEGIAPDGIAGLDARLEKLNAGIKAAPQAGEAPTPDPAGDPAADGGETLAENLASLEAEIAALTKSCTGWGRDIEAAREKAARAASDREALALRCARLEATLPPIGTPRDERHAELKSGAEAAQRNVNEALRQLAAWSEAVPAPEEMAALEHEIAAARQAIQATGRALADTRESRREIEGALRRDMEDGVEAKVLELEEQTARLRDRLAWFEREVTALALLETELETALTSERSGVAEPIARALGALAADIFPGVEFSLAGNFGIDTLMRDGIDEPVAQVSHGTREQIAVLVRLALAQVLAEGSHPLPVILDDAVVFADDDRLAAVLAALAAAASHHQVFVLTCHARAFEPLVTRHAARLLSLEPWSPTQSMIV